MKSILLIGLGRFGYHMALKFRELHHEVLAIDRNETRVNQVLPYVTNAQIAHPRLRAVGQADAEVVGGEPVRPARVRRVHGAVQLEENLLAF